VIGISVSILILLNNDIYSNDLLHKIKPRYEQLKSDFSAKVESDKNSEDNLHHANFIASFITTHSEKAPSAEDSEEDKGSYICHLKTKVHKFIAVFTVN